ncbi:MAG TPA: SusC/RagA family TonB-linked outer membrane protein [Gemmatimonadales bacterium]|nr:SusC/RagA family TonB-linked outer membrane protein [Gemmatimonadales bacterium]
MQPFIRRLLASGIACACLPAALAAQEPAVIRGTVTGEGGRPIANATVNVVQLGLGATTREDGRYTILVPAARATGQTVTVTVRAINFKPQSHSLALSGESLEQNFVLAPNPLQLGEIVVTGAGTTSETEKLGSVRNNVDAQEIVKSNESNVVEALAAKAPNVEVTQSSGEPGASAYIAIRGIRTIGTPNSQANQPLFVVDGLPIDNSSFSTTDFNPADGLNSGSIDGTTQTNRASDINPNDIESVEILKGAAAAAIYGARAAQGVVLITTKHGRPGATRYSLRSTVSLDDINKRYPLQTRYGQGIGSISVAPGDCDHGVSNFACRTSWGGPIPAGTPVFDHAEEAYRTGVQTDNVLSVSGGNDRTTFFLSGGYNYDRGIFVGPNNSYQRTTARLNASHRLTDNLKVGGNFAYTDGRGKFLQRGNNTNGLQLGLLRSPPNWNNLPYLDPTTGLHRSFRFQQPLATDAVADRGWDNPFFVLYENEATADVGRTFGNINAEWTPAGWLKFNYTLGADYSNDERLEANAQSSASPAVGGRLTTGKITNYQIDHNLTGTLSYRLSPAVAGTFTLGQNLNSRNSRYLANVGRAFIAPAPFNLGNTVTRDVPYDQLTEIHGESYFGQATLDLWGQVYLSGALRNDGSSTFDQNHRRSWFPKGSFAWNFLRSRGAGSGVLTYGKLRASYGEAGTEPTPYLTSNTYPSANLVGGFVQGTGLLPSQGGNGGIASALTKGADQLEPERTKEFETGFDLGLIKDKADLSFTFYHATSSGVILLTPLAPSTGFFQQAQNVARIRNQGVELTLNVRPVTTRDFAWDVGIQWARNRSKTLDLGSGVEFVDLDPNTIAPHAVAQTGEEVGVFRDLGLVRCGISPNGMDAVIAGVDLATVCAGQPFGAYYIGDGSEGGNPGEPIIDPQERIVGNPNPRWTGSIRTGLRVGKVQVSGLLDIRHGGQVYNGTRAALLSYGTHQETEARADCSSGTCVGNEHVLGQPDSPLVGPVVGPGAGTPISIGEDWYAGTATATGSGIGGLFGGTAEQFLEDGGYVKLREISIGYTLDQPWVQRTLGFSSIELRLSGRNLKTWTKYTGYDPETNLGGAIQATRGVDYFNMPQNRSFVFGVTLNR